MGMLPSRIGALFSLQVLTKIDKALLCLAMVQEKEIASTDFARLATP